MFDKSKVHEPHPVPFRYADLETVAQADPPPRIVEWEASPEFQSDCEARTRTLLDELSQHPDDKPLFFSSVLDNGQGVPVVNSRDIPSHRCALFFSSRIRADVYAALHLHGVKSDPIEFTAREFVSILDELGKVGTSHFVLDRCPRCWNFLPTRGATIGSPADAISHLAAVRANESVRADFYLEEARNTALAADYPASRTLALAAIAHIAPDDSRFHAHLAALAGKMRDTQLAKDAQSALEFFKAPNRLANFLHAVEGRISMFF
jgi:hypothetical protein